MTALTIVGLFALLLLREWQHGRAIEAVYASQRAQLDYLIASTRGQAEALGRLVTTGSSVPVEPRVEEREPDATERLARTVSEQTIARGVAELREAYRALGQTFSDDDLRVEVEQLLTGVVPSWPHGPSVAVSAEAMR